ncbi:MAG TPA: response regulator, partial [Acetobacteraceae bacterium]|nr:response regulator [Acetobacteraceae bacterium]
ADLAPGAYVVISITDTGAGMSADVIGRAFEPFFTTKPIGQGTGLGLSMVYGFARQSGGHVCIYSEMDHGTTVRLYLPRHGGAEGEAAPVTAPEAEARQARHGETVLVVDDEPAVRMLVSEVLAGLGYAVIEAADGAEALHRARTAPRIDLLITDVGLPGGMNGRQVADAARELRPSLLVLFITGYAENAVIRNGYLEPGMQVMSKPFALDALAAKVRSLIEAG